MLSYSQSFNTADFSVFAGASYSTIKGDSTDAMDGLGNRFGYLLGLEKPIFNDYNIGLAFVEYGYKIHNEWDGNVGDADFAAKYLGLYITKIYNVNGIGLILGPYAGYFIGADVSIEDSGPDYSRSYSEHWDRKDWKDEKGNLLDIGIIGGLSFPLTNELSISANYYYGFRNIAADFSAKNRSAQIYLEYNLY